MKTRTNRIALVTIVLETILCAVLYLDTQRNRRLYVQEQRNNNMLVAPVQAMEKEPVVQEEWRSLGQFKITYYWPGEDEYGSTTAVGTTAQEGRTIAVDPSVIPYGSRVKIDGHIYTAEDCGGAVKGNVIDIFVEQPKRERAHKEVFIKEVQP